MLDIKKISEVKVFKKRIDIFADCYPLMLDGGDTNTNH